MMRIVVEHNLEIYLAREGNLTLFIRESVKRRLCEVKDLVY